MSSFNSVLVLGPTASGKTKMAVKIALEMDGEIVSIDSRQVYKRLDIGTGKDLHEYSAGNKNISYHLIDIIEPDKKYNISLFVKDFYEVWKQIKDRNKLPVLCGGTGLYMDAILKKHEYINVPVNQELRAGMENMDHHELIRKFQSFTSPYHAIADISTRKRTIRAMEIARYLNEFSMEESLYFDVKPFIVGVKVDAEKRRKNISERLLLRIQNGLIEEVENLIQSGISKDQLIYFGLEYKWITEYVCGNINKSNMIEKLCTEIHRYSRRQMTWYRKMEREGFKINWIEPEALEDFLPIIREQLDQTNE